MTEAAQAAGEAEQASLAFHVALTQIGAETIIDALSLWDGVNPTKVEATTASWLARAMSLILTRRKMSRDLMMGYYRLTRALRTGYTVADPQHPDIDPKHLTMDVLRHEFASLVDDFAPKQSSDQAHAVDDWRYDPAKYVDGSETPVKVEKILDQQAIEKAVEKAAEGEAYTTLLTLGPDVLTEKLKAVDPEEPAKVVDKQRDQAHFEAGARQASGAERLVLDGARSNLWSLSQADKRVIGYARVSRTGTPCGWCAMLISRKVLYKTKRGAEYKDGDKYHNNCHCYAEPVYSAEQFANDPKFDLNRKYAQEWPKVTKGYGGKEAVSVWRKYIRAQQAASEAKAETKAA